MIQNGGAIVLLKSYRLEIFNNECMPGAMTVQCFAHLDQDVSKALPYLNTVLGGFEYTKDPPSVTFRPQGKLVTVHANKIAINALKDEEEARKIVEWLQREINAAWERRDSIEPSTEGLPRPKVIEIFKQLPRNNCGECGAPTCLVFATMVAEGSKGGDDCPPLDGPQKKLLLDYMLPYRGILE
jgi:ArsR family metal-binding transcriptional regulator